MAKRVANNPNHWSDIVGMPDAWDKKNLTALINKFKKQKFTSVIPGYKKVVTGDTWIKMCVAQAREAHGADDKFNDYNLKSKDSDMRAITTMPPFLQFMIAEAYPTLFKDKAHSLWFAKNFPEFRISKKL